MIILTIINFNFLIRIYVIIFTQTFFNKNEKYIMKKTLFLLIMILFSIPTYTQCLSGDCNNGYGEKSYNGHIYKGNFLNGKRDGYGEYFWEFGDVYKGYWKNDDWDGYGERTYAAGRGAMSGVIEKGRWENGILVDPNAKPKINKPLVNKNNSNSQNKSVASVQKNKPKKPKKIPTTRECECCGIVFKIVNGWMYRESLGEVEVFKFGEPGELANEILTTNIGISMGYREDEIGYHSAVKYHSKRCAYDCGN